MPFVARCPNCTTELDVGDDVAAEQPVECPVCLTRFVPDRPPAPPPSADDRPPDRPARRDRDDDDYDDEDLDRPRRRRRRRGGRGYALDKVSGPAGGLLAIGWIGVVLGVLNLFIGVLFGVMAVAMPPPGQPAPGPGQLSPEQEAIINGGGALIGGAKDILLGVLIIYGARKMKALEGYGWAMAAAWLSVLPCFSPCCILGLIFGIQAIQALNDADVKAAFRGYEDDGGVE